MFLHLSYLAFLTITHSCQTSASPAHHLNSTSILPTLPLDMLLMEQTLLQRGHSCSKTNKRMSFPGEVLRGQSRGKTAAVLWKSARRRGRGPGRPHEGSEA